MKSRMIKAGTVAMIVVSVAGCASDSEREVSSAKKPYWYQVQDIVLSELQYPRASRFAGETGVARVKVVIKCSGEVVNVSLLQSSGYAGLDKESIDVFQRIGRFPEVPGGCAPDKGPYTFEVPTSFGM